VDGLVAAADAGVLKTVTVNGAGGPCGADQSFEQFPRPDVKERYPKLTWLQDPRIVVSGFRLRAPLTPAGQRDVRLVTLTPVFERGEGHMIVCIVDPALPLPDQQENERSGIPGSSYQRISQDFCGYLVQLAGLRPTEGVLDVGCGFGRMAYSLAHYLTPAARYRGFDVDERPIRWCRQTITPRFPHFLFRHVDLRNGAYNPGGTAPAGEFVFPYEDGEFDLVFLASVFTHMAAPEVRHYLGEIHRVLKPGGRCLATFFLLNREARRLIGEGKSAWDLVHPWGEGFTATPECPEACAGYEEADVRRWLADRLFKVAATWYGLWCGRSLLDAFTHQDMIVLHK
jgi:SAM-dependent methyltransferase